MNKRNTVTADQGRVTISTILKKVPGTVLALMVLGGCMNPLAERPSTGGGFTDAVPDGYGRVTVTLAGTGARTLYPAEGDFGDIILSFQGPAGASHEPVTGGSATVDLALGAWTITATAYTKAESSVAAAWGREATTIGVGDNDPVHITLAPYTGLDAVKGTLRYDIGIGGDGGAIAGLNSATITVTKTNADDTDGEPAASDLHWSPVTGRYADTISLDAGNYLVQVKLTRGYLSATRGWVAHLYPGLETLAACDFGELDLKPALLGTVSLGGSAVYGEELTATSTLEGIGDLSYVWKRGDTAGDADTVIEGASSIAYTLTADDVGKYIAVEVSLAGYDGNKRAVTAAAVAKRLLTATAQATDRVYNGTKAVTVTITAGNVVDGDAVSITGTGAADSADVGNRTVSISGIALTGAAAGNYTAPAPASITGVTVAISKATPVYTTPTPTAFVGQTLADVTLSEGFDWDTVENPTTTPVGGVGSNTFKAKYTPEDTGNYLVAEDIPVNITVTAKTLTITVSLNLSHEVTLDGVPSSGIMLSRGGGGTATISAVGYTNVKWYVDGVAASGAVLSDGGNSITLSAANYDVRNHQFTFRGVQGGVTYSKEIGFKVSK
ncbi:YDG domain-containing protein [Treponema primitia]|uniref:YDG domain-containing protein n=1 Tax=Treponema primitia TaxID=88058 RepID=UPI0002555851|nr:YDG domain-containing protein [Treponema primitia]